MGCTQQRPSELWVETRAEVGAEFQEPSHIVAGLVALVALFAPEQSRGLVMPGSLQEARHQAYRFQVTASGSGSALT